MASMVPSSRSTRLRPRAYPRSLLVICRAKSRLRVSRRALKPLRSLKAWPPAVDVRDQQLASVWKVKLASHGYPDGPNSTP